MILYLENDFARIFRSIVSHVLIFYIEDVGSCESMYHVVALACDTRNLTIVHHSASSFKK